MSLALAYICNVLDDIREILDVICFVSSDRRVDRDEVRYATDDSGLAPAPISLTIRRIRVAPDALRADLGHFLAVSAPIQADPNARRFEKIARRAIPDDVRLDSDRCPLDRSGDAFITGHGRQALPSFW